MSSSGQTILRMHSPALPLKILAIITEFTRSMICNSAPIRLKSRFWTTGRWLFKKLYWASLFAACLKKGTPDRRLARGWTDFFYWRETSFLCSRVYPIDLRHFWKWVFKVKFSDTIKKLDVKYWTINMLAALGIQSKNEREKIDPFTIAPKQWCLFPSLVKSICFRQVQNRKALLNERAS